MLSCLTGPSLQIPIFHAISDFNRNQANVLDLKESKIRAFNLMISSDIQQRGLFQ